MKKQYWIGFDYTANVSEVVDLIIDEVNDILKPKGLKGELKAFLYNKSSRTLTEKINIWLKIKNKYNI